MYRSLSFFISISRQNPSTSSKERTMSTAALFDPGAEIEISSNEAGFEGAWFEGRLISYAQRRDVYTIEYDSLLDHRSKRLREVFAPQFVRPRPPRSLYGSGFQIDQLIDAFHNDGWWIGSVCRVSDGTGSKRNKYCVQFPDSEEEIEFDEAEIRPHLEWINGEWVVPDPSKQKSSQLKFKSGMMVEVSVDDESACGSWYTATIVKSVGRRFLVKYEDLRSTEDEMEVLPETVDALHMRPTPPRSYKDENFKLLEEVDAFHNNGWRIGVISKVLNRQKYMVYFRSSKEALEFEHKDLRLHHDWIGGRWSRISQEVPDLL